MDTIKPITLFALFCLSLNYALSQEKSVTKAAKDTVITKVDSLKAAIVTATMRPHIKGDTIEYNTEHTHLPPNGVVEDLLKRLPGLQIAPDGTITYNGEKIQHLLVDGEDIFGSTPTLVTQNFDASKIAKVQILDRKSDQAIFTGIDDGTRIKTLNLVMKESTKNGYFGKVEAGGDANKYYNANGVLAAFRDKEQFTALGLASNTGTTGLTSNAGASSSAVSFYNGNPDALGASAGTGIPRFNAAAFHYANTWNALPEHLTAMYQYSHYFTNPITTTQTIQTQSDSIYGQIQRNQSINQQTQHLGYGIYDWTPNSKSAFQLAIFNTNSQGQNQLTSAGSSTFNDTLVNSSQRNISDKVSQQTLTGYSNYRISLGKQTERTISFRTDFAMIDNTTNGYLYSLTNFYQPNGAPESTDTVDERKQITDHSDEVSIGLSHTEPLWKKAMLGLDYSFSYSGHRSSQGTYDRGNGKYPNIVDTLSSDLKTQTTYRRASVNLQGKSGRLSYTLGNEWSWYEYHQKDLLGDSLYTIHNLNWAPRALLNYTPDNSINFKFIYTGATQQPSITQLLPVRNNSNPLKLTLGNPSLKPTFDQNFRLEFHHFKTWLINVTANCTLNSNSITTKTTTDSLGRQITQPFNIGGEKSAGLNFSIYRKLFGFDAGVYGASTFMQTANYINAALNRNDAYTGSGGVSLNKYVPEIYSIHLNTNFTYFYQVSSIDPTAATRYWSQSHSASITLFLIKGFELNTNATYTWQQKTSAFQTNTSVLLLNGFISRNFLKNKLVARFQLNNIFDQNAGITRTNTGNINTQNSTNILGRYWLLTAIYHFENSFKKRAIKPNAD